MKKKNLFVVGLLTLGLLLSACQPQAAEVDIVRVAFPSSLDIDDIAALIAFEKMQD